MNSATGENINNITTDTSYSLQAHMYSFFTGFLYLLGGSFQNRFRRDRFTEFLPIKADERILDICCANGKGTNVLALFAKDCKVTGIDIDPKMISFAIKNSRKVLNVNFRIADCTNMPFPANTFNIVNAFLALHEIPNELVPIVLNEIKRTLKKDGLLLIFELKLPKKSPLDMLNLRYYLFRLFEDENASRFMMVDQVKLVERSGFNLVKSKEFHFGLTSVRLYKVNK